MLGRTNTGGGGSGGLNFQVIGGTTAPNNPKENTIWVNTSTKITDWVFSATQPSNPSNGMVWFSTGTSSTAAFNALKKNGIQVYPISTKQYVSGAWVDKTAKSWQNGAWVEWFARTYLFKDGNTYEDITGGWIAVNGSAGVINSNNNIYLYTSTTGAINSLGTEKEVYKGNYTRLCAEVVAVNTYAAAPGTTFIATRDRGSYAGSSEIGEVQGAPVGTWTIDISTAPDKFYVSCYVYRGGESLEISKIWME